MSRVVVRFVVLVLALGGVITAGNIVRVEAGPISCTKVISEIDRATGRRSGKRADVERIARKLHVEQTWVQRCAWVYGRRLSKSVVQREEAREDTDDRWEAAEREERSEEEEKEAPPATPEQVKRPRGRVTPTYNPQAAPYEYDQNP